ncbi:metallophosphoesterase [Bordetella trematum]|uniref:Serine/threonine protein phosphatase n=1 Tax=Bordetella trematum TaxID=123899 RepID=A0A157SSD3_9BORD|nr:metallophosphoesterase [Bordetella trematum]AUL47568.1 metallophosphoesterase [Bordetella trematum]AZR94430.1 metallophosphoesterase [Bordetella trematum]NNH20712.1 serine/threonine protein phosphatase [Bordetella trematum]QIM72990.1 serine/threonine protein phosphatase [Bordetella trematum]SAI25860.1 serine/threonine protein phosphatase [Bordetella trematum]
MLQQFSCNQAGRDIAVGDIHGCFGKLEAALRRIGFAAETDRLFAVGDLVDRGPESHRVMEWLRYPWFHAVSGNHEQLAWRRALGDPVPDIDHVRHGGQWLDLLDTPEQLELGRQLRALPLLIEVETRLGPVGLVHADFPYDDWRVAHTGGFSVEDEETCLWSMARYRSQYHQPIRHVRAVVHGHLTLPRMTQLGNVLYIDTGGWRNDGHFTLLDLHTLKPAR